MKKFLMLSLLFVPIVMLGMEEESKNEPSVYDDSYVEDYGGRFGVQRPDGSLFLSRKLAAVNLNEEDEGEDCGEGDETPVSGYEVDDTGDGSEEVEDNDSGEKSNEQLWKEWSASIEKRNKAEGKKLDNGKLSYGEWCRFTLSCYGEICDCQADEDAKLDGEQMLADNVRKREWRNQFYQDKEQRMAKQRAVWEPRVHDQAYQLLHEEVRQAGKKPGTLAHAAFFESMPEREYAEGLTQIKPNPKNVGQYAYRNLSPAERDRLYDLQNSQIRAEQRKLYERQQKQREFQHLSKQRSTLLKCIYKVQAVIMRLPDLDSRVSVETESMMGALRRINARISRNLSKQLLSECFDEFNRITADLDNLCERYEIKIRNK